MSFSERKPGAFFSRTVFRTVIPLLVLTMIATTAVTGAFGLFFALGKVDTGRVADIVRDYAWIAVATAAAEGIALLIGIFVLWRLMRRLGDAADEMQQLTRSVLHDLSTPIAHIDQEMELLQSGVLDLATAHADIHGACARLLEIVRTNAEISQTYEGLDRTTSADLDLTDLIRKLAELYGAVAEEKGIALILDLPANAVRFNGHVFRLQRLIGNLLDNALKYTSRGGSVTLALQTDRTAVTLSVKDTGIGIPQAALPRVFERFFRAEASRTTSGSGLGLALVHAIVTFYRGTVSVTSKPGCGSVFTIRLPYTPQA